PRSDGAAAAPRSDRAAAAAPSAARRPAPAQRVEVVDPSDDEFFDDDEAYDEAVGGSPWAWLVQPVRGIVTPGRPWQDAPIHPIRVTLPAGQGFTIRACFEEPEEVCFLDRDGRPLLFRSAAGLARHLDQEDHVIAGIEGWPEVKDWFTNLVLAPDEEDRIDLEIVPYILQHPPQQWLADVLVRGRDLAAELAEAFDLQDVSGLIAGGSPIDELDDALRLSRQSVTGWSARRRLRGIDAAPLVRDWRRVVDAVDRAVVWED
ncbi:hypothetical protein AB0K00_57685, partial [Dactylosporangium sp. NPDC049525]